MKKLMAALILTAPFPAMACGELADYDVQKVSFAKAPVKDAVRQVFDGGPFQFVFEGDFGGKVVSASGVSGPLDAVLGALADQAGFTYAKDRCVIKITAKVDSAFSIRAGESLQERLELWAKRQGYALVWEASEIRVGMGVKIDKDMMTTLEVIKSAMKANGIQLDIAVHDNPVIRVTEIK